MEIYGVETLALTKNGDPGILDPVCYCKSASSLSNFYSSTGLELQYYMGLHSNSPMLKPAQQYLTLRSFGAPAVILFMAIQGIFRGIKDTRTPLYATIMGDVTNIILDPLLMFTFRLGVSGAAIAHIISQYLISLILLWSLMKQVVTSSKYPRFPIREDSEKCKARINNNGCISNMLNSISDSSPT